MTELFRQTSEELRHVPESFGQPSEEFRRLTEAFRHIRDKIRQQLQVLRDTGFLIQPERGVWQLK